MCSFILDNQTRVLFAQYNETADYAHRCFNGTLVQATNINKQVYNLICHCFVAYISIDLRSPTVYYLIDLI